MGGGPTAKGELNTHDGRKIPWSYSTRDGAEGTVKIDGQVFDLSKGGLLLVRTNGQQTQVEQLAVDLSKLKDGPLQKQLQSLGDAEPRIAEFFQEPQAGK
jgi:hypothetical protein